MLSFWIQWQETSTSYQTLWPRLFKVKSSDKLPRQRASSTTFVNYRLVFPLFINSRKQLQTQHLKFNFLMKFRVIITAFPLRSTTYSRSSVSLRKYGMLIACLVCRCLWRHFRNRRRLQTGDIQCMLISTT